MTVLTDWVVEHIRAALRTRAMVPGATYSGYQLAADLGISRSPVRDGLLRLAATGLIEFTPNRGFRIIQPTETDIAEIYALRIAIEVPAAQRAARILAIAQQLTVDVHAAGANVLEHIQAAQERRLARTRGAKDDADLAGSDIQVYAPQDVQVAEELVDSANGDHGRRIRHGVTSKNLSLVALASSSSSEEDDVAGEWVPALSRRSKPLP